MLTKPRLICFGTIWRIRNMNSAEKRAMTSIGKEKRFQNVIKKLTIGEFVQVKITKAYDYDIEGDVV